MLWRRKASLERQPPDLRDVVETTMRWRSARFTYLPGALDRIVAHAPPCFYSIDALIDYVADSIEAEEIPIDRPVLAGWFEWFEHAHEMV